jgi:hypothetical protein
MEIAKIETAAIEKTIAEISEYQFQDLSDLELVMVGGGQGDISLG